MGRRIEFTQEIADAICERLAQGESLRSVCRDDEMPSAATACKWLADHPSFAEQYARAKEAGMELLADEIMEIADDSDGDLIVDPETGAERTNHEVVARSKLRVDTRKWLMSKLAPKKYGDKVQQQITGADGAPLEFSWRDKPAG